MPVAAHSAIPQTRSVHVAGWAKIKDHPFVASIYSERLVRESVVSAEQVEKLRIDLSEVEREIGGLESAQHAEHREAARAALRDLPPDLRLAIELRFGEDLTFKDVARALDVSEPTAHERVQRGLATLRHRLRASAVALVAIDGDGLDTLLRDTTRLSPAPVPSGLLRSTLSLRVVTSVSTGCFSPLSSMISALSSLPIAKVRFSTPPRMN